MNNAGVWACASVGLICFLLALLFALMRGKAAILISGFNTIPKSERKKYDREWLSRDHRNLFLKLGVVMVLGALLSWIVASYMSFGAFAVWLILLLREVHLDEEKAFGKYKIK